MQLPLSLQRIFCFFGMGRCFGACMATWGLFAIRFSRPSDLLSESFEKVGNWDPNVTYVANIVVFFSCKEKNYHDKSREIRNDSNNSPKQVDG